MVELITHVSCIFCACIGLHSKHDLSIHLIAVSLITRMYLLEQSKVMLTLALLSSLS